jgi:hypothetical protein
MSDFNRPRPTRVGQPDPAELGEFYRLRDATLAALRAYLDRPGPEQLKDATEIVSVWRRKHGPIECGGFGWSIDGKGELFKWRSVKRGKGIER